LFKPLRGGVRHQLVERDALQRENHLIDRDVRRGQDPISRLFAIS
jgi:hypothetical protein